MKPVQVFALIIGLMFLSIGVMGFIPELVKEPKLTAEAANLGYTSGYGYLLGLFPVNVLHNLVHFSVGVLGLLASISQGSSRLFSGVLCLFYGTLTILGLFPPTWSTLGLIPIFGNDVWLHASTSAIAWYFGFYATPNLEELTEAQNRSMSEG